MNLFADVSTFYCSFLIYRRCSREYSRYIVDAGFRARDCMRKCVETEMERDGGFDRGVEWRFFSFLCRFLCGLHCTPAHSEPQQNWASICRHLATRLSLPTVLLYTERRRRELVSVHLDSACGNVCLYLLIAMCYKSVSVCELAKQICVPDMWCDN